tara:strand:- start:1034 stop:1411 length:378 start_codon:yes stop_codon:yes gene_type:complete
MNQIKTKKKLTELEYFEKIESLNTKKLNIIYPYKLATWKGSNYIKNLLDIVKNKKIKIFINCEDDLNLVLELIQLRIERIIYSNKNETVARKVKSLAKKYGVKIFDLDTISKNKIQDFRFMEENL